MMRLMALACLLAVLSGCCALAVKADHALSALEFYIRAIPELHKHPGGDSKEE